jgi:hypothetical protein
VKVNLTKTNYIIFKCLCINPNISWGGDNFNNGINIHVKRVQIEQSMRRYSLS